MTALFISIASILLIISYSDYFDLPFYDCSHAQTNYDLGYCIGTKSKQQVASRWNQWSMIQYLYEWIETNQTGKQIYEEILANNQKEFPLFNEEGRGIANGADFEFKQIFIMVCIPLITHPIHFRFSHTVIKDLCR